MQKKKNFFSDHYNSQVAIVELHFRELHDQLHFKEVDVKRELKSYYDENVERYTIATSELESNIKRTQEMIGGFKNEKSSSGQTSMNQQAIADLVRSYSSNLKAIGNGESGMSADYVDYLELSFSQGPLEWTRIKDCVKETGKGRVNHSLKSGKLRLVRQHYRDIEIKVDEERDYLRGSALYELGLLSDSSPSLFYQSANLENGILIFTDKHYILWKKGKPEHGVLPLTQFVSSIYDGSSLVYLVDEKHFCAFDIHTKALMKLVSIPMIRDRTHFNLSLDQKKNHIYLVSSNLNEMKILKYDLSSFVTILDEKIDLVDNPCINTPCGCYVSKMSAVYYFTSALEFNLINVQSLLKLKRPKVEIKKSGATPVTMKLQYDGNDFIYLIAQDNYLMRYTISENKWTTNIKDTTDRLFSRYDYCSV